MRIAVEGINHSGKSILAEFLSRKYAFNVIKCPSEKMQEFLKQENFNTHEYFRLQIQECINYIDAYNANKSVIFDRGYLSHIVYPILVDAKLGHFYADFMKNMLPQPDVLILIYLDNIITSEKYPKITQFRIKQLMVQDMMYLLAMEKFWLYGIKKYNDRAYFVFFTGAKVDAQSIYETLDVFPISDM